jgi:hypothetical protein
MSLNHAVQQLQKCNNILEVQNLKQLFKEIFKNNYNVRQVNYNRYRSKSTNIIIYTLSLLDLQREFHKTWENVKEIDPTLAISQQKPSIKNFLQKWS